jgi:hypothetical protein
MILSTDASDAELLRLTAAGDETLSRRSTAVVRRASTASHSR